MVKEWILVLLVFSEDGNPTPKGVVKGGIASEEQCLQQAKQDTPRVRQVYPNLDFQWECRPRKDSARPQKPAPTT